eukprot:2531612-Pleurochrysis_carterae.AAC.1
MATTLSTLASPSCDLARHWNVEDEGPVFDVLNVDIAVKDGYVCLSQSKHIEHLANIYVPNGVPDAFHATHVPATEDLPQNVEAALLTKRAIDPDVQREYISLVGALLYCSTQTRPDVAYSVSMLFRAMSCPTGALLEAARRVLMHLYLHRAVGLRYVALQHDDIHGFADSDWATRHLTSGYVFIYGQAAVS